MLQKLGVTVDTPYFTVDGVKVFTIYDPPHTIPLRMGETILNQLVLTWMANRSGGKLVRNYTGMTARGKSGCVRS